MTCTIQSFQSVQTKHANRLTRPKGLLDPKNRPQSHCFISPTVSLVPLFHKSHYLISQISKMTVTQLLTYRARSRDPLGLKIGYLKTLSTISNCLFKNNFSFYTKIQERKRDVKSSLQLVNLMDQQIFKTRFYTSTFSLIVNTNDS